MSLDALSTLRDFRKVLTKAADPSIAPGQQAYMKSSMPFHGVKLPVLRALAKTHLGSLEFTTQTDFEKFVLKWWNACEFREERYAALALTGLSRNRKFLTLAALPFYEKLIISGAWWDVVDEMAGSRFQFLYKDDAVSMAREMRKWSRADDLWLRRSAIISQLKRKQATDLPLLFDCIEPSLDSTEFFLRKAIGWALRQLSYDFPAEVRRYVNANEKRLSGLSRREALKVLERKASQPN